MVFQLLFQLVPRPSLTMCITNDNSYSQVKFLFRNYSRFLDKLDEDLECLFQSAILFLTSLIAINILRPEQIGQYLTDCILNAFFDEGLFQFR